MLTMFRTLFCTLMLVAVWALAVAGFAFYINQYALEENARADGIVVLTGGGGRIEYGLELFGQNRGRLLFISGVGKQVPLADLLVKAPDAAQAILNGNTLGRITLGREAANTIGNARESTDWIKKHHLKSVLLVTADYHMPRALMEFSTELPGNVILIPAPVKTQNYIDFTWIRDAEIRNIVLAEFHKLIAAQIRHYVISTSDEAA
ncbi:MAG: YdcF family protein [Alphaproteobacteria bacterium]|nr:YdcF family protein [Alphaproteobacteria bacterium]